MYARKVERFLSQPFFVAEAFTGTEGKYVPIAETVRSFREILDGKHDDLPEGAFYMKGTIEQVLEDHRGSAGRRPRAEAAEEEDAEPEEGGEEEGEEEGAAERVAEQAAAGVGGEGEGRAASEAGR